MNDLLLLDIVVHIDGCKDAHRRGFIDTLAQGKEELVCFQFSETCAVSFEPKTVGAHNTTEYTQFEERQQVKVSTVL
jgi:hypothetical protein